MANEEKIAATDRRFQRLLEVFLLANSSGRFAADEHLDQDTLAAFVEGGLTRREAEPVVAHLADCGFCRNISVELIRLDLAFAETSAEPATVPEAAPARISDAISRLFSRLLGGTDAAVFAHQEHDPDDKEEEKADNDKENDR